MGKKNKRKSFSERLGITSQKTLQRDEMDRELRVSLWNSYLELHDYFRGKPSFFRNSLFESVWKNFLREPMDEFRTDNFEVVKKIFLEGEVHTVMSLIEHCMEFLITEKIPKPYIDNVRNFFNEALEDGASVYRIINNSTVGEITGKYELGSIREASNVRFRSVSNHINKAVSQFADRKSPDYPNSVKESISAIEALAKEITGKDNAKFKHLVHELPLQHPALISAIKNLYGFASDGAGIRNAKSGEPLEVDQGSALFILIICSSLVNYIIFQESKLRKS